MLTKTSLKNKKSWGRKKLHWFFKKGPSPKSRCNADEHGMKGKKSTAGYLRDLRGREINAKNTKSAANSCRVSNVFKKTWERGFRQRLKLASGQVRMCGGPKSHDVKKKKKKGQAGYS